jgi:hypothetical protein
VKGFLVLFLTDIAPSLLVNQPRNAMDIKVQKHDCQRDVAWMSLTPCGRGNPRYAGA